ncbi:MAG: Fic family protein [Nitrosopumilaceae archaeon]|nr:Fic family protein [Nitrosopumilaceae archaeon]
MHKSEFSNPSGRLENNRDGEMTFVPALLPPEIDPAPIAGLIAEAHMRLGVLEGLGKIAPNPDMLIGQYLTQEAVSSSGIEGTEATSLDVYRFEVGGGADPNGTKRVQEVVNYINASRHCLGLITGGDQVDLKMIKRAHAILLTDVRGQDKNPGKIRKTQNWIGYANRSIRNELYVPPATHRLDGLLANFEKFIVDPPERMPILIRCAVAHYQFEAIHPFGDGNGRVGRLLIPMILASSGALSKPLLYLSSYFEQNRTEYYELLREVSKNSRWLEWVSFFLTGVIQSSNEAIDVTHKLLDLKSKYEQLLRENRASRNAMVLADYVFAMPVVTIPVVAQYLKTGYPPAKKAVTYLVDAGILELAGAKKRNKEYVAREIVDVFS